MKEIRHTGIVVSNMEDSLIFYRDIMGLETIKDSIEKGEYIDNILGLSNVCLRTVKLIADDDSMVELLQYMSHANRSSAKSKIYDIGYSHIAFTVDNLDKEYKRLLDRGIKFNHSPCISSSGYAKVTFCKDPDGNFVELVEILK